MVEIETNSSSDFAAARDRLSGAMSPAELEALAGFAPWANPKPEMQYASPAAAEPAAYGAAEPAVALFLGDDEALTQPSGSERPLLTLVTDNGEAQVTQKDASSDASELLSYILTLDEDIKKHLTGEIAALTSAVQSRKSSGVDVGAILVLVDAAKATAAAGKASESAEARREALFKAMDEVNQELDDFWAGVRLSPSQRAALDEAKEREEEARRRYEANPTEANRQAWVQASQSNVDTQREIYEEVKPTLTPQKREEFEPKILRKEEVIDAAANNWEAGKSNEVADRPHQVVATSAEPRQAEMPTIDTLITQLQSPVALTESTATETMTAQTGVPALEPVIATSATIPRLNATLTDPSVPHQPRVVAALPPANDGLSLV